LIDKETLKHFTKHDFAEFITQNENDINYELINRADEIRKKVYGKKVYLRALIEISNYCKNNCLYCGIQNSNINLKRYRLSVDEIFECVKKSYVSGFRTVVLQGGEDLYFSDETLCELIKKIKDNFSDIAVTLSLGERAKDSYQKLFDAGADRYLLRHESANENHYAFLHDGKLTVKSRMECLKNLKEIGFQTGAGFMVGSPNQTNENIGEDLVFIRDFKPHMVGIGPFLSHKDTKFKNYNNGSLYKTITALALVRIMLPNVLLPATTALNSLCENGRDLGLRAGCNVLMPNASPVENRKNYSLYDNKKSSGTESKDHLKKLEDEILKIGYEVSYGRGDFISL